MIGVVSDERGHDRPIYCYVSSIFFFKSYLVVSQAVLLLHLELHCILVEIYLSLRQI